MRPANSTPGAGTRPPTVPAPWALTHKQAEPAAGQQQSAGSNKELASHTGLSLVSWNFQYAKREKILA